MKLAFAYLCAAIILPAALAQDLYDGCPMTGSATRAREADLNPLKNRYLVPSTIDSRISLRDFYDDLSRKWDADTAVTIEGLVDSVKAGGIESCNCKARDAAHRDTHISLVLSQADYGNKRREVIVEVTPRWRAIMAGRGVDWSTAALKKSLTHRLVRFTGWIFYDKEHEPQSESTNPGVATNWRATPAEVHPVTEIEILQ